VLLGVKLTMHRKADMALTTAHGRDSNPRPGMPWQLATRNPQRHRVTTIT